MKRRSFIKGLGAVLLGGTTALYPAQAMAMPQVLAGIFLPLIVSSPLFFLGPAAISAIALGLGYAAVIGIALVAQSFFRPRPPKPEDVQTNFRQVTPNRMALYGEGLLGGPWVFGGTSDNNFHRIIALSSRTLAAVDGVWIDDKADVTFDGDPATGAFVTTEPYGGTRIRVEYRLGTKPEAHYSYLTSIFSEWTSDHRGDGVASIYTVFDGPAAEDVQKFFPSGVNTLVRARCRGVKVYDPTDEAQDKDDPDTWTYSDNLARCVFDYLRHPDGFRIPDSLVATPLALEGWAQAVADCDDPIQLAAGGTEPRYRLWGIYNFNERPADVLTRFMQAGNARLKPVADGGVTLEVGKWQAPTVTIDETMIVAFDGLARGRDVMQTANVITSQFTSADAEYQSTDAQPWIDEADVAERGEIPLGVDFINAPSHGQCRRLMKIEARRSNPADIGTFVLNKKGVIAYGERFVTLSLPELDVAGTFEVLDFQFIFGEHSILIGCSISVQSIAESAYAWNAALEEGSPGGTENPPADNPFGAPLGFEVTMEAGGLATIVWDEPASAAYSFSHIQVENLTTPAGTQDFFVDVTELTGAVTGLAGGDDYRFRMRYQATLSASDWTDWETRTAIA